LQLHPWALIVVDEDATAGKWLLVQQSDFLSMTPELHVKTVKYFKSIERVQDEVEQAQEQLELKTKDK